MLDGMFHGMLDGMLDGTFDGMFGGTFEGHPPGPAQTFGRRIRAGRGLISYGATSTTPRGWDRILVVRH